MIFTDRRQAGILLAERLKAVSDRTSLLIGLPRGGVVVAAAISEKLALPLDVVVVKKIPSPMQSELGVGALAPDGVSFVDWKLSHRVAADEEYINAKVRDLSGEIRQRTLLYRKGRKPLAVKGKNIIVVDDGAATGATLEAAIKWLRKKGARRIIAAVPVASLDVAVKVTPEVDQFISLEIPPEFDAVGQFYKVFPQISDAEVVQLLQESENQERNLLDEAIK